MSGWMLSVDFGTSNTAAAHTGVVTGAVETLSLTHQGNLMSSAVFVESPATIDVGDVALNRAETNPAAFIPSPKRVVGQGMVHVNGYDIPASLPVAAVLHTVIGRATAAHRDQAPTHLVLTHPEGWSPREVGVLLDAAARVGYGSGHVSTVSEPRAAAHYYSRTETMPAGTKIAVFDFGGGTLDIAVLTATDANSFDIIAARGDNSLGGKNLDAVLRGWVDHMLNDRNPDLLHFIRTSAPLHVTRSLDDSIQRAKELLSSSPSATITVNGNGHQETLSITRPEFESLIAAAVDRAIALTRQTLIDAGITHPSQLSALYLTGGSSRIPLVHQRLAALGPIATLDDPKTVVAQGALIGAGVQRDYANPQLAAPGGGASPNAHPTPGQMQPAFTLNATAQRPHTSNPSSSRKLKYLAAGGALVAIGAIVAAVIVLRPSPGNSNADNPAAAGSTSAPTTTAGPVTDAEAVKAALPAALSGASENCRQSTFTTDGALVISCDIKKSNQLAKGFSEYGNRFTVSLDLKQAKKTLLGYREYDYGNYTLVENDSRTAGVNISDGATGQVSGSYVNMETGLTIDVYGMTDTGAVTDFFRTAGLL
ncbi:Hsp70 family protein [Rhodococcus qingshengii]|uniref:Hsp70 family protein n=1 Tax=Rhodococcus erythropolis group TaxID=2840174 RepID=UPI0010A667C1|nr:Hsp70 family protein [Rhodococcus qingshengii]MDT9664746.1 Hsp70 family protein [Rhodococcus qingshengii]THJ67194.1 Hsp70 family protein [Rhodococcus qingshengii]